MPALVLMMLLVFQLALRQHAAHVVTAAAQEGASAAQAERGTADAGRQRAQQIVGRNGNGLLNGVAVNVSRGADITRVTVSARVVSLVPGFNFRVEGVADGPTERFRARAER